MFTDFWAAATSSIDERREFLDNYCRHVRIESSLNGITRALGWERTVSFVHEMQRRRRAEW